MCRLLSASYYSFIMTDICLCISSVRMLTQLNHSGAPSFECILHHSITVLLRCNPFQSNPHQVQPHFVFFEDVGLFCCCCCCCYKAAALTFPTWNRTSTEFLIALIDDNWPMEWFIKSVAILWQSWRSLRSSHWSDEDNIIQTWYVYRLCWRHCVSLYQSPQINEGLQ